jgi:outer membrane protein OmpA-like peptidoglycan-associated protein
MANTSGTIHRVTDGGIAADHIEVPLPPAIVAATHSGKEYNTLKQSIIPFACWRAHDMRFAFDSSFVLPEIAVEIALLKDLIDSHTVKDEQGVEHKPALSVFGHADPTGNDDYNKALSGRRAQAIYALLTRKTDLWEELFNHPGDHWGKDALGTMLDTVTPTAPAQPSAGGTSQSASPKPGTGPIAGDKDSPADQERETQLNQLESNAGERKKLFKSYMDVVCASEVFRLEAADQSRLQGEGVEIAGQLPGLIGQEFSDEEDFVQAAGRIAGADEIKKNQQVLVQAAKKAKPFEVKPEDFLAGGKDKGGKADYQGCGEFNPVFLQSQKDIDEFEKVPASSPEKPIKKAVRDAANEPDRRVLIFLFRPGIRINPDVWPCPRVKEGVEGCKKRFWSDGEKRRNTRLPDRPRKFEETKDTFGCRFYDRISANSPCERHGLIEDFPFSM